MSYADYSSFRTAIYNRLDITTSDITTTSMDDCIRDAEELIFTGYPSGNEVADGLRVDEMETAISETITTGGIVTAPSGYLEAKQFYLDSNPIRSLSPKSAKWIRENYPNSTQGLPNYFGKEGTNFIFGPAADSSYTLKGIYFKKPTSMQVSTTINSVFSAYPNIFLAASCAEVERFLKRFDSAAMWDNRALALIYAANRTARKRTFSGGPLSISAG